MGKEEKLIGPRAHEREAKLDPHDVRLADDRPLYYVFLTNPETLVVSPDEVREAKQELSRKIEADPDRVLSCQGKTLEDAKEILESIKQEEE